MDDVRRVEHLFSVLGGVALMVPDLPHTVSYMNDAGSILVFLRAGLSRDDRATILAGTILRHAVRRLDPVELLTLLHRAMHGATAGPRAATAASVATWIPEG